MQLHCEFLVQLLKMYNFKPRRHTFKMFLKNLIGKKTFSDQCLKISIFSWKDAVLEVTLISFLFLFIYGMTPQQNCLLNFVSLFAQKWFLNRF